MHESREARGAGHEARSGAIDRIGVFGGTFDPIHQGHLIIAEQVREELGLSVVLFVPGGIPPHKEASSIVASTTDRVAMVEAAISGNEHFVLDLTEAEAQKKMYSYETVRLLKDRYEAGEWYFISGADEVANLPSWKEPDRLLSEAYMVAATRPGYELSELDALSGELENYGNILPVRCSRVDISATGIRERLASGRTIRYLVPDRVNDVIRGRGLYGARAPGTGHEMKHPEHTEHQEQLERTESGPENSKDEEGTKGTADTRQPGREEEGLRREMS